MGCFTLCILAASLAPSATRLGLSLNVPAGGGEEDFLYAMREQIRMGLDGGAISLKWDEYEAQGPKSFEDAVGGLKFMGQEAIVTIATLDTIKRRLPADLTEKKWNDPEVLRRWEAFLRGLTPKLGPRVKWLSLGNEVDGYLASKPEEVEAYRRFLSAGRKVVKSLRPELQVGVTVMSTASTDNPDLARRLQEGMDVAVMTYYPLDDLKVRDPLSVSKDLDRMVALAAGKPLVFQEIGYPASERVESSPSLQEKFVRAVFAKLDTLGDKVPLAVYFLQSDFTPDLLKALEGYYGVSDPRFLAFLGSLGLKDSSGKARPAWTAFQEEVLKRKPIVNR